MTVMMYLYMYIYEEEAGEICTGGQQLSLENEMRRY